MDTARINGKTRKAVTAISAAVLIAFSAACSPRIDVRGNLPDADLLEEVKAGGYGRDDVVRLLGSPSTTAMFENETWFYVSQKTETVAFLEPEVVEQTVVILQFGAQGDVASVDTVDLEDGKIVTQTDRVTPTLGNDLSIFEQVIGNVGRFNVEE